jgi:hypothetical protein
VPNHNAQDEKREEKAGAYNCCWIAPPLLLLGQFQDSSFNFTSFEVLAFCQSAKNNANKRKGN